MYGISVLCSLNVVRLTSFRFNSTSNKRLLEFLAKMPKPNSPRIADAQRQRRIINKKSEKYSPSTIYLQVIGSGARGAPNTLYLFTDQKRYLFNCGESTQRLAHEHKVKLSKLEHIFITSKTWRNIGGLPGLSLTLQDVGVPNITLHGPEGLDELYNATKRFVIMKDMNVNMAKCSPAEDFTDSCMSVKYVLLFPNEVFMENMFNTDRKMNDMKPAAKKPKLEDKEFEEFIHDETDYYSRKSDGKDKANNIKKKTMKKKTDKVLHDLQKTSKCSVAYICKLKNRPGTLDLAKCVEKGVKPGPLLGQLKNGQDVILPDGTMVLSKDVKTPDDPGPVFIVMEVPHLSYLKESEFSEHFDDGVNPPDDIPALIVHFTPPQVFNDPKYRKFLEQFGPTTRHLVLNSQNSCLGSEAVHRTQHKLHLLDNEIFPLLKDASIPAVWNSHPPPANDSPTRKGLEELKNKIALAQFQNIINMESSKGLNNSADEQNLEEGDGPKLEIITGKTLTMYHLRPKRQLDRSAEPKLHIQEYIQETMDVDGFVDSLEHFKKLADTVRYKKNGSAKEYPKVVFLGTGSCIPSKTRNTSSILVQIHENSSMLLDCGEGTFGQLVRFFGPNKVNSLLKKLHVIYVSHLHADHHIGLIGLLQARREAFEQSEQEPEPLFLLAPGQIYSWLSLYDQSFEKIRTDFNLIPNQSLLDSTPESSKEMTSAMLAQIGVNNIRTCLVSHCPNAFGIAIEIDDENKITYSGDTIPCQSLVDIGQNSTLLIHEATMEDELSDEARMKMHSTTSQALEVAQRAKAKYTLLTHFSQRYARLPRLSQAILHGNNSVGIAFDNMQITMNDLALLPYTYAPLQLMFAEHCVEMEMKAAHRNRHKGQNTSFSDSQQIRRLSVEKNTSKDNQDVSLHKKKRSKGQGVNSIKVKVCPRYRESNASRLRQEMKGMAVTGVVKPVLRSNSSSPVRAASSNVTNSNKNDNTNPVRLESENFMCFRKPFTTVFNAKKLESENFMCLNTTDRCLSESSNLSKESREKDSEFSLNIQNVDAQLRVISAMTFACKEDIIKSSTTSISSSSTKTRSSYRNSLVASLNAKISIKKTVPPAAQFYKTPANNSEKKPLSAKNKFQTLSESKLRAQNKEITLTKASKVSRLPKPVSSSSVKLKSLLWKNKDNADKTPSSQAQYDVPDTQETLLRNLSTEKLKQQICRELTSLTGRPSSAILSIKSFKPQLEDIQSSYLILNKAADEEKDCSEKVVENVTVSKPKPLNELLRKTQLDEAKKKFQSRRFKEDSRYDKIEGLNWISWK